MNTSTEAVKHLEQAITETRNAVTTINNLIAEHDYQDVAGLVSNAAMRLLESASLLMQNKDEPALEALEAADEYLDSVYAIIEGDLEDEE